MPCAPGMLRTTTFGLPGRGPARKFAINRPDVSVPHAAGLATMMLMFFPSNEGGSAADAIGPASTRIGNKAATRIIVRPPRTQCLQHTLFVRCTECGESRAYGR